MQNATPTVCSYSNNVLICRGKDFIIGQVMLESLFMIQYERSKEIDANRRKIKEQTDKKGGYENGPTAEYCE